MNPKDKLRSTVGITITEQRATAKAILTPKQYAVWDLVEIHNMALRVAAAHIGIGVTTLRDHLDTARQKLKENNRADFPKRPTNQPALTPDAALTIAVTLLIQRDGPNCYLCRTTPTDGQYQVEHIIPRLHGGTNDPTNLALACANCNAKKGSNYVSLRTTSGRAVYHHPR